MRPLLILLALAISLPSRAAVEVANFRSGLACTETSLTKAGSGWICQPTEDVLITDQGVCVFNGAEEPCTWIGFEFDYKGAKKGNKLQCVSETSAPVDAGNPGQLIAKGTDTQPYELELTSESGHFFNPQYFVFGVRSRGRETLINTGRCMSDGQVVFEYRFNIRFPVMLE
jgi:hypothetical protein